jgi:NADH-quinone oxidoreductase subunit H
MSFALFWLGEYGNVILMCALNAILFWGGFLPPLNIDLIPWFDIPAFCGCSPRCCCSSSSSAGYARPCRGTATTS